MKCTILMILLPASAFVSRYSASRQCRRTLLLLAKEEPQLPNFCSNCASSAVELRVPPGDERLRACCNDCGAIVYVNPKVVVACVVRSNNDSANNKKCLLAKRAIEPRLGYWGIPQGFLEMGETTREGAVREAYEETGVIVEPEDLRLRAVYNVPGSVQLVYEAVIDQEAVDLPETTLESSEIRFFDYDALPELCFPTVQWALDHCFSRSNADVVQQKTKLFDAESNTWREIDNA